VEDVSKLTLKSAGNYYTLNPKRSSWTWEQIQNAKGLSPYYKDKDGKIFLVYDGKTPLTVMFLQKGENQWLLCSLGGGGSDYLDAAAYFTQKTGIQSPAVLYSDFVGMYYFFDDQAENGYVMSGGTKQFYWSRDILEYQYNDWQEIKDMFDENGHYKGEYLGGCSGDVLDLIMLTPVEPVKQSSFSIWYVILPVIVLAAAGVVIFLVRRKKGK
jgi:hypothetical protein